MKKPIFNWNEEDGTAFCSIEDRGKIYYGIATCSPNDQDMKSEKTGCEIAFLRASIMGLRAIRDEVKHELNALKKYYYSINRSKYFDQDSYPIRRLLIRIESLEQEYSSLKELVKIRQQELTDYISNKTIFYNKIRRNRKKVENK